MSLMSQCLLHTVFLKKVIDEIGRMYQDAGVELPAFHVGGDEVPEGIWEGSAICRTFL